ncbi:MAG: Hpt domain-containing protein [Burkholderiaceae bacterium]
MSIDRAVFADLQSAAGPEFVAELLDTFFEEAPSLLAELRAAQAASDATRLRRAAHSIKSNGLTFGAGALAELARGLELNGLPAAPAQAQAALDALDAAYAQAAHDLRALRDG